MSHLRRITQRRVDGTELLECGHVLRPRRPARFHQRKRRCPSCRRGENLARDARPIVVPRPQEPRPQEPVPRVELSPIAIGAAQRCPFCLDGLGKDEEVTACLSCRSVLHEDCWDELGRCPTLGCGSRTATTSTTTTEAVERAPILVTVAARPSLLRRILGRLLALDAPGVTLAILLVLLMSALLFPFIAFSVAVLMVILTFWCIWRLPR